MNRFWRNAFILIAVLIVIGQSFFVVDQRQQGVVTRFGEPVRVVNAGGDGPGLKAKIPFVDQVAVFEKRNQALQTQPEEMTTADRRLLVVDGFVRYRIDDPLRFYRVAHDQKTAAARLNKLAVSSLRGAMAQAASQDVLSGRREALDGAAREDMKRRTAATNMGVTILDLRIRRADLPPGEENAIFERMSAGWRQQAAQLRAQTEEQREQVLAEAETKAAAIRAETAAERARIYASSYGRDPEFAAFYQTMKAYDETLARGDTTVVVPPDSEFFSYLQKGPAKGR
ncbi:MAG: protease modulator HflC [Parcubacteria group bacterium]